MKLDPTRIAAESHVLVPIPARQALGILHDVERALVESGVTDLRWRDVILRTFHVVPRPGMRSIAIRHRRLREWTVCIAVNPQGSYVAVGWYLIARPSWRGDLRRFLRPRSSARERETIGSELNARRRAELGYLDALTRQALQRAIEQVTAPGDVRARRPARRRRRGRDS